MDDWLAAARLAPENLLARSRLALSFERTGRTLHALTEYMALAAILQKNNQRDKALQAVDQAIRLQPANQQVARARAALQAGEMLAVPPPLRLRGTAPLVPPKPAPAPAPMGEPGPKPEEEPPANAFEDAQLQALAILANLTFESTREPAAARRAGLEEFDRDATTDESGSHDEVLVQLAKAIDAFIAQNADEARAVWESDKALDQIHDRLLRGFEEALGRPKANVGALLAARTLVSGLERIGDHATNIAEQVLYMKEGNRD
jgi:tetratricopeptide (TPR) repeat protein